MWKPFGLLCPRPAFTKSDRLQRSPRQRTDPPPRNGHLAAGGIGVYFSGMSFQFKKHFQLEEARGHLGPLRTIFSSIHASRDRLVQCEKTLDRRLMRTGGDLGGETVRDLMASMLAIHEGIRDITSRGIQIKDLDRGLVDFPHLRDGREVFLCWELEEEDIEFWHETDCGYAGRERL